MNRAQCVEHMSPDGLKQILLQQEMYNTCNEQQLKAESFLKEEFGASEHILDYYSCALQRGILLQGWMYITYSSMCFYANIMGAITKEAFSFSDVTNITKVTQARIMSPRVQLIPKEYAIVLLSGRPL